MAERFPCNSGSRATSVNYGSVEVANTSAEPDRSTTGQDANSEKEKTRSLLARENAEATPGLEKEQPFVRKAPYPYAALAFIFVTAILQRQVSRGKA